jgi:hypothetical protein
MEKTKEEKLQDAMNMEDSYRLLQSDGKAKDTFGYHDKLKSFGFDDTVSYERAKDEYYLKNSNIPFENIDITELKQKRKEAVEQQREVLHIITGSGTFVYGGVTKDGDGNRVENYNSDYCKKENLFIFEYPGLSSIVATEYDLAISLVCKRYSLYKLLLKKLRDTFGKLGLESEIVGNDILVDGKKIVGSASWMEGKMMLYNFQISFVIDQDKISKVCSKEVKKIPVGISEVSNIDRDNLLEEIKKWLQ